METKYAADELLIICNVRRRENYLITNDCFIESDVWVPKIEWLPIHQM